MREIRNKKEYNHYCILRKTEFTQFIDVAVRPFFSEINYSIKTRNGSEIEYNDLDNLLEWNNFNDNSIVELTIHGRSGRDRLFVFFEQKSNPGITFGVDTNSIYLSYSFSDIGNYNNFEDTFDKNIYLIKNNDYNKKLSLTPRMLYFSLYIILILGINLFKDLKFYDLLSKQLAFILLFYSVCTGLILLIANSYYKKYIDYYPPVVFYFGDGINSYENAKKSKNKMFSFGGQLIIGIASSLIVYHITSYFK